MTLRKAHGNAAKSSPGPRVEVPPADELGAGVHVPVHGDARDEREADGRWRKGARSVQSAGGRGKRQALALSTRMGLGELEANPDFAPFHRAAQTFAAAERKRLRETVAAGQSSPAMDAVISSAAWQKATSEYLFAKAAKTGDADTMAMASRMANDSRQNLLAAHHLAELAAKSAPKGPAPIFLPSPKRAGRSATAPAPLAPLVPVGGERAATNDEDTP